MKSRLEIIYRRRIMGDVKETIEILLDPDVASKKTLLETFDDKSVTVSFIKVEDNNIIYSVELPKNLRVKPPDWGDLAYDHAKVKNAVYTCVIDNSSNFIFAPINDTTHKGIQNILSIALADLSSVIDLVSVEIKKDQENLNQLEAIVIFAHKNGEAKQLGIKLLEY